MADDLLISSFDTVISDQTHKGVDFDSEIFRKKVKADISDIITDTDPNRAPFLRFLELLGAKEESSFKFEFLEENIKNRQSAYDAAAGDLEGSASNVLLAVKDADLFVKGDVLKILDLATGLKEIVVVAVKLTPKTYTIVRAQSGTTGITAIADDDEVIKIGSAFEENTKSADPDFIEPRFRFNYTQTFKSTVSISGRFDAMNKFIRGNASELQHQLDLRQKTHIEDIETAFMFGRRHFEASTQSKTYTGGIQWWLETFGTFTANGNIIDATNKTFNEAFLDDQANDFFRFGSNKKLVLVSGKTLSKISTFAKDFLRNNREASKILGLAVTDYMSPHGALSLVHSRVLEHSTVWSKMMFVIDPQFVKKRFLPGRDTHINTNVQENDRDGIRHEILSDIGLELRNPDAHFIVENIDNTIT